METMNQNGTCSQVRFENKIWVNYCSDGRLVVVEIANLDGMAHTTGMISSWIFRLKGMRPI